MWRLYTVKVVEQQTKICALECSFDQLKIRIILYLTPEEIQEIKNHQTKVLVDLPSVAVTFMWWCGLIFVLVTYN